jgi:glucose-1-phosphate cytidylyltransferase
MQHKKKHIMWEHGPMETLSGQGKVCGYQYEGFWQYMDTTRDIKYLEDVWQTGKAPWKTW